MDDYKLVLSKCRHSDGCEIESAVFPFCPKHMEQEWGLVTKESSIPHAGNGLFFVGYTDKDGHRVDTLKKGSIVTYYSGKEDLSCSEYDARFGDNSSYGLCCADKCLDGGPTDNYPGRLMNHRPYSKANVRWGNSMTVLDDRYCTPMYAMRAIKAGRELFVDYGRDYWKGRKHKKL